MSKPIHRNDPNHLYSDWVLGPESQRQKRDGYHRDDFGQGITDPKAIIPNYNPHYTNDHFKHAQTVYGQPEQGLGYDYSDRIWEWNWDKAEAAKQTANAQATYQTAEWVEIFLSIYFERAIEVKHILAGFNLSSGYPYQVFGYRDKK